MNAKGGALVIGSLFWDPKNGRKEWWNECLEKDQGILMRAPIRYGRYSYSRNGYTMVFSSSLSESIWGFAYVLPHKETTCNEQDLKMQALRMAKAEGIKEELVSKWASLAILINPMSSAFIEINEDWTGIMEDQLHGHPLLDKFDMDIPSIDTHGIMVDLGNRIFLRNESLSNFDFLLATVTVPQHISPHVSRYPTPEEIAYQVINNGEYFYSNYDLNIQTFQDKEILYHYKYMPIKHGFIEGSIGPSKPF